MFWDNHYTIFLKLSFPISKMGVITPAQLTPSAVFKILTYRMRARGPWGLLGETGLLEVAIYLRGGKYFNLTITGTPVPPNRRARSGRQRGILS